MEIITEARKSMGRLITALHSRSLDEIVKGKEELFKILTSDSFLRFIESYSKLAVAGACSTTSSERRALWDNFIEYISSAERAVLLFNTRNSSIGSWMSAVGGMYTRLGIIQEDIPALENELLEVRRKYK